jgi:alpha,alpha-trehalase
VIFDMDGVITDTARVHFVAWKRVLDEFLVAHADLPGDTSPFGEDDYRRYVDGKQRDDGVESFLAARRITLPRGALSDPPDRLSVWGLANRKNVQFKQSIHEEGVVAYASSVALVQDLRSHDVGTAVVSASRNCREILQAAGVEDLFTERVDGIDAQVLELAGKPAPAMFLEAARRLAVTPDRAAIVEDALAGVEAGRRGGFRLVVGVDRVGQAEALRSHGAHVVVADLGELRVA